MEAAKKYSSVDDHDDEEEMPVTQLLANSNASTACLNAPFSVPVRWCDSSSRRRCRKVSF